MKNFLIGVFLMLSTTVSFAQIDLESVLEGGPGDAQAYLRGYLSPFATGFGNGLSGGWYSTAKAHKFLGIDIAIIANAAIVPTEGETFTFNNADFTNIKLDNSSLSSAELPTAFGSQALGDRPLLEFSDSNGNTISTSSLPGVGLKEALPINANVVPSPMVQLGVGLFKNTDLKVRFVPKQTGDGYEVSSAGFGLMHDIKQWIPFVKRLPFDVSVFAGFNNLKSKFFFDTTNNPSQAVELNTRTATYQLLASKKLLMFTLFGGIGTTSYDTDVNLLGTYTTSQDVNYTDPVSLNYTGSSVRANLGLSIKLLFLKISAEYAKQEYDVFTATVGISIR